jgi:hypothetical protein
MGITGWFSDNWFSVLSSLTGIGGLWFAGFAIHRDAQARREETKARKYSNQIAVTANHREVWKEFFRVPGLRRVIEASADIKARPVTAEEEFFVQMVIANASLMYEALKDELVTRQDGFRQDLRSFFSLPIPSAVWDKSKLLQNHDFAAFIDSTLKDK